MERCECGWPVVLDNHGERVCIRSDELAIDGESCMVWLTRRRAGDVPRREWVSDPDPQRREAVMARRRQYRDQQANKEQQPNPTA